MNKHSKRNWYPLSFIPAFDGQIDQLLDALEKQHSLFLAATPGALDDEIIAKAQECLKTEVSSLKCV